MMSNATKAAPPTKVVGKDDNTTTISKQLSWMLRHGAKHRSVGLSINAEGWIKLADILKTDYFKDDFTKDKLMQVIVDSNSQKPRYQLSADEVLIRAYTSAEQKALKESGEPAAPKATAPAAKKEASSDGGGQLRGDAPEFVPAATNPAAPMQMPMQFPGFPWPGYGFPQFPGYGFIPPAPARPETAGKPGSGVREWGKIKSFNAEKGYGFIESPRIFQQYGRDLFVHKAQLGNFKVGDEVHLTFTLNEQGYPQAKDLVAPGQAAPADKGKGKGKGKDAGKGKGKDGKGGKGKEGKDSKGSGKGKESGKGKKGDKKEGEAGNEGGKKQKKEKKPKEEEKKEEKKEEEKTEKKEES